MEFAHLSDAALNDAIDAAHAKASGAPFGEFNLHADGTAEIRNPTSAWARFSDEWCELCAERDKRKSLSSHPEGGET